MPNPAGPLNHAVAIVDAAGRPTQQFMRLWSLLETESAETGLVSIDRIPVGEISFPLSQLLDVNLTGPVDGQVLTYHAASGTWRNATGAGGGGTTFSGLSDVSFVSLMDEDLVAYSSGSGLWRNRKLVNADIGVSLVTQHQAALILSGNQITSGVVAAAYGGTGFGGTYVQGSLLYGNALGGLDRTLGGATTDYLRGGPAPSWQNLNTAIDLRIDTNRNITSIWSWTTGELRINDTADLLFEEKVGEPAGVIGYVSFYFDASDSGRPYYKLGTGGTPIAFSIAGHTHVIGDIVPGTFGAGFTWQGNVISEVYGGTGFGGTYVEGSLLYGNALGGLSRTLAGATTDYLRGGATPSWQNLNTAIDARIDTNRNITSIWTWTTGQLRINDDSALLMEERIGEPAGVIGYVQFYFNASDSGRPYYKLGTGGTPIAFSIAGHTHGPADITGGGTFGSGNYTFPGNLTLSGATASLQWSGLSSGNNFVAWGGGGMRKITTQGGLGLFCDSMMLLHAGDNILGLISDLGITAGSNFETLFLTADGHVYVIANRQTSYASRYEWSFRDTGTFHLPTGQITSTGVITGLTWNGAVISEVYGGTGFGGTYVEGSLLYGNSLGGLSRTLGGATTDYLRGGATPSWQNLNNAIDARIDTNRNITSIWSWTTGELRINDTSALLMEERIGAPAGVVGYVQLYFNASDSGRPYYKLGTGGTPVAISVAGHTHVIGDITPGTLGAGFTWNGNVISAVYGGTGFGGSYVAGSILHGNGSGGLSRTIAGATTDYLRGGTTPSWQNLNTAIDARVNVNRNITTIWTWTTGQLRIDDTGNLLIEEFAGTKTGVAGYVTLYPNASNSGRMSYKLGTGGTLYWLPRGNAAETITAAWTFGAGINVTGAVSATGDVIAGA